MVCEIISVGTELLMGEILNSNTKYLSKRLSELGIDVHYQTVVGDNTKRLTQSIHIAMARADIIITTGGLGPTQDDLTKEIVCECFEKDLILHEESLERIKLYFNRIERNMPDNNIKQAMLPAGCIVLQNNNGTAPGCIIDDENHTSIMLPGPPSEMTKMFEESVVPYLMKLNNTNLYTRLYKIIGVGESSLSQTLDDLINSQNPTVAPYAKCGEVHLRMATKAENEEKAHEAMAEFDTIIKQRLGDSIYSIDGGDIAQTVVELLIDKNLKISAAESCTGGMFAKMITDVSGSSAVINESYITYANESKVKILDVNPKTIDEYGVVSEQVASQMAEGVARISGADIGVGITGIAGPGGATKNKPVGLVHTAVWFNGNITTKELRLNGSREEVRYKTCLNVFDIVRKLIK